MLKPNLSDPSIGGLFHPCWLMLIYGFQHLAWDDGDYDTNTDQNRLKDKHMGLGFEKLLSDDWDDAKK